MTRNIAQLPNNNYTPETAAVYTTTGFNAGDLVYFQNGTYVPATSLTSLSNTQFAVSAAEDISGNSFEGAIGSVFNSTNAVNTAVGGSSGKFAAVLTSGNIVQVWATTSTQASGVVTNAAYFQIVNTSGTVLYGPTLVSNTYGPYSQSVYVLALTGGGFVIFFAGYAGYMTYGVYTNTGAVTTAIQLDSTALPYNYSLNGTALANGGFALAYSNASSSYINFRAYGATGTPSYAWAQVPYTYASTAYPFGIASRSDSSIAIAYNTGSTDYVNLYNTSGSLIASVSFGVTSTPTQAVDITCLADGSTYVVGYYAYSTTTTNHYYPAFRLLPSSNTLGAENAIPYSNMPGYYFSSYTGQNFISLMKQSGGGFVFAFTDLLNGIQYAFFNSSGTAVSGTNTNGTLPIQLQGGYVGQYSYLTMIEISGYVNLYWTSNSAAQQPPYLATNQNFAQINETTYQPVPFSTTTVPLGNITAQGGSPALSTLTPTSTKFYPATTSTYTLTTPAGFIVSPTVIYNTNSCHSISSCSLPNGQFLVAYMDSVTAVVYVAVYSITGVLQQTITVGTSTGNGTYPNGVKIAALSSGKFVVGWLTPGTSGIGINLSLYSSSFTLISTTAGPNLASAVSGSVIFQLAGLAGTDRYVLAYIGTSNYANYSVYNNANTLIVGPTNIYASTSYYMSLAADDAGGFGVFFGRSSYSYFYSFVQTGTNTYTGTYPAGLVYTGGAQNYSMSLIYQNNQFYGVTSSSTTAFYVAVPNGSNTLIPFQGATANYNTSFAPYVLGVTGNGGLATVVGTSAVSVNITNLYPGISYQNGGTLANTLNTNTATLSGFTTSSSWGYQFTVSPSYGNAIVITWLDGSGHPNYCIYNTAAFTSSITLTAGSTLSNTVSIYPNSSTASGVLPNTILAGVALTNASANSTGQLLINGITQLNSSYTPITYQAFDHTGQAIDGVKGIVNGLQINLQGNS